MPRTSNVPSIAKHGGSKYIRQINEASPQPKGVLVDVYQVIEAFDVACPATQHAIKKLLCAGLRGKATRLQDLIDARDAIFRAIEMQHLREAARTPQRHNNGHWEIHHDKDDDDKGAYHVQWSELKESGEAIFADAFGYSNADEREKARQFAQAMLDDLNDNGTTPEQLERQQRADFQAEDRT